MFGCRRWALGVRADTAGDRACQLVCQLGNLIIDDDKGRGQQLDAMEQPAPAQIADMRVLV